MSTAALSFAITAVGFDPGANTSNSAAPDTDPPAAETWQGTTSDFDTATNWNPANVPSGIATFASAGLTSVTFSQTTIVAGLNFVSGAQAYTITASSVAGFAVESSGVVNNSGNLQTFAADGGQFEFAFGASAGSNVLLTASNNGFLQFGQTSSAAGAKVQLSSGGALFVQTSGNLDIGALSGTAAGTVHFLGFGSATPSLTVGALNTNTTYAGTIVDDPSQGAATGSFIKTGTGTLTLTGGAGALTYGGTTTINGGVLAGGASNAFDATSATTITASGTLDIGGFDQHVIALSGAGVATDSGGSAFLQDQGTSQFDGTLTGANLKLEVVDDGALTLTGGNSYAGTTVIQGGSSLSLSGGGSIADSDGVEVSSGGTFDISATASGASIVTLADSGPSGGAVALGAKTLTITNGQGATFSGVVSGSGGLTISGSQLVLSGANTYMGGTTISAGTLTLSGDGSVAQSSAVNIATGGTFDISRTNTGATIATLADTAEGQQGAVTLGSQTLTLADASTAFSGVISGSGGLTLSQGTQVLAGANTFDGATTVNGGTLEIEDAGALGDAGVGTTVAAGATLAVVGDGLAIDEPLTLAGAGVGGAGALDANDTGFDGDTLSGAITLASDALIDDDDGNGTGLTIDGEISGSGANLTLGGAGDISVNGAISLGAGSVTKDGSGTVLLAGPDNYFGLTTVNAGFLQMQTGAGGVVVNGPGNLVLLNSETFASISGSGTLFLEAATLTTGGGDGSNTFSGLIADGDSSDIGGLIKTGAGTLTLTGGNSYSAGTTISRGALELGDDSAAGVGGIGFTADAHAKLILDPGVTIANVISGFDATDGVMIVGLGAVAPAVDLSYGAPPQSFTIAVAGNVVTLTNSDDSKVVYSFHITGQEFTTRELTFSSHGDITEKLFEGVTGQGALTAFEFDYAGGNLIATKLIYAGVSSQSFTSEEVDFDSLNRLTRIAIGGVSGAPFSAYEFDYVGGIFSGSKFTFTSVPQGATFSSYEVDYDQANAFADEKLFSNGPTGSGFANEERDFDANVQLSRVVLTGAAEGPNYQLELDFANGVYDGYKAWYSESGQAFTALEADFSTSNQLQRLVFSGLTTTPYSSLEQTYANGQVTQTRFDFTDVSGANYNAFQITEDASDKVLQETFALNTGAHTLLAESSGQTLTSLGLDKMTGFGATTFVLDAVYGADTITNFASGDTVSLSAAEFSQLGAAISGGDYAGGNAVLSFSDGDTLTFKSMTHAALAALSGSFTSHG